MELELRYHQLKNYECLLPYSTGVADFSTIPVRVTFASGSSPETVGFIMGITDDTIHETDQIFMLRLEVISDIDRSRLVPQTGLTSFGRIIDDDG